MPIGGAISALCATVTDIGCCQEEERMGERERERERERALDHLGTDGPLLLCPVRRRRSECRTSTDAIDCGDNFTIRRRRREGRKREGKYKMSHGQTRLTDDHVGRGRYQTPENESGKEGRKKEKSLPASAVFFHGKTMALSSI